MFGFLNINKPAGLTSHDVVYRVRRLTGKSVKVGHAGTLDPFATGVLVVCVGPATRLADYIQNSEKRYHAGITLGTTSTTDDVEGELTLRNVAAPPSREAIKQACSMMVGEIQQIPPSHSAVHVDGQRAYKLARRGDTVELTARTVRIDAIEVIDYDYPTLTLDICCGSGTYIRSIARDLGEALRTGGYCSALERSAVGAFTVTDAKAPDDIALPDDLHPAKLAVTDWPKLAVPDSLLVDMNDGKALPLAEFDPLPEIPVDGTDIALFATAGDLLALAVITGDHVKPRKVFRASETD